MNDYGMYMIIMAGVTYLIRMIPITLCQKELKNTYLQSFLYYVPYAVLSAMTFPAIFSSTNHFLSSCIGCLVGLFFAYREKGLLQVALWATLAAFLVEIIL